MDWQASRNALGLAEMDEVHGEFLELLAAAIAAADA